MKRLSILTAIILAAAALMASFQNCYACTGITLKAKDGSTVVARTIEWAASDNDCRWVVVPRGHTWKSFIPGGGTGRSFTSKYGYVGVAVVQDELMMEGMNEKGLSAGLFYFPDYGRYEEYSEANYETNISDFQLVSYILGRCATVDEVKAEIANVHVHGFDPRSSTVHWRFAEPSGRQIVLEIIDGKCVFYENTLGVLTNSPSFDWQLTNLNNYVNLLPGRTEPHALGNMSLSSFGGGSAMLGLPGDFTPPSRFVRAAFFQNTAQQKPNAEGSVFTAFHILGSMEIPIGAQFAQGQEPADIPSATQCTCVTDMSGLRFYYRSMYDGGIRCIDLKEIDFKKVGLRSEPLIPARKEYVHYIKF